MELQTFLEEIDNARVIIDTKSAVLDKLAAEKMKQDKAFRDAIIFLTTSSSLFIKKIAKIYNNQRNTYSNAIVINAQVILERYWPIILTKQLVEKDSIKPSVHVVESVIGDWQNFNPLEIVQNVYKNTKIVFSESFEKKYREMFFQEKDPNEIDILFIEMLKELKRMQKNSDVKIQYDLLSPARLCYRHDLTYTTIDIVFESLLNPIGEKEIQKIIKNYDYNLYSTFIKAGVSISKIYKLMSGWVYRNGAEVVFNEPIYDLIESYRDKKNTICHIAKF